MSTIKDVLKSKKSFVSLGVVIVIALSTSAYLGYSHYKFVQRGKVYAEQHKITFNHKRINETIKQARDFEKEGNIAMALTKYKEATNYGYPDFEKVKARLINDNKVNINKSR